ncbi:MULTISPECIES: ArsR/SmtB family transcription factor [Paraburkholderia]|jgi:ArsR family transcriptional regulator|uniref:Transcriptional regulator, ArsR family n=1 Tax=Paraburkholderia phenazinium TaxID=60549 RepID=A0A1N6FQS8_9BURK|nr:helix-turn-helix domain-containing protein [Paraburkholderia phenazinium]SIN97598.1 transcriptional regulator, ArsR family [Paraburkholderia phenazinium]
MRNAYANSIPADWEQFAAVFAALGDSYRQRILLFFEPGERLTIKQIADVLPLSRTAVLHHVRVLQSAGLLESSKEGREVFLTVNKALLLEALTSTVRYAEEQI